jgi:hypothetical protein
MTTTSTAPAQVGGPRLMRRAVEVPALADLQGPKDGTLTVPRKLYWSGGSQCGLVDMADLDQVALAYESIIDTASHPADLVRHLNAEMLTRLWRTLGVTPARRQAWETKNPELAAPAKPPAVAA